MGSNLVNFFVLKTYLHASSKFSYFATVNTVGEPCYCSTAVID